MRKNQESSGRGRTRSYAFLVYPDSAPADWRERLSDEHVECLISPLHDDDVNPDGTQKKPHYHVLVMFSSVKSEEQANELRDKVGGVGRENVASTRGYARYLCHLDNPEKAQYSIEDVVELGGADYQEIIRRSADSTKLVGEMIDFINDHDFIWYDDFMTYCRAEKPEWFDALVTRNTYAVYTYMKSRSMRRRQELMGYESSSAERLHSRTRSQDE